MPTGQVNQEMLLREMFDAAVKAAMPQTCVPPFLPTAPAGGGKLVVVGAGKASAAMARAVEDNWDGPLEGLVVTRYDYGVDCDNIEIVEAAHPVPDAAGLEAARRIKEIAEGLGEGDVMLCLISGGGSSLLTMPAEGMTLEDKQAVNSALLKCGATISEMNCVRKHLSAIKGGRLAIAAYPAKVISLLISDVPGDDPSVIASGPTVSDDTTYANARKILQRYEIELPGSVQTVLEASADETPDSKDLRLEQNETRLVALPQASLEAGAEISQAAGYETLILGDAIEGIASEVAREHAALALEKQREGKRLAIISGGETTVIVRGPGRGGRNSEYMLAMAEALDGAPGIYALACDTDGIDGTEDNAGAMINPDTLKRATKAGTSPQDALEKNDSYGFFETIGDLVVCGPTFTNVNDFRVVLVEPAPD
jgi:glycerate 2-kinase